MTREKAIIILENISIYQSPDSNYRKALEMAIKALEKESCEDCISREAVIEILGNYGCTNKEGLLFKDINDLPSIQPKPKTDVLDKIKAEIDRQQKWLLQAGHTAYNVDIALDAIKAVVAESENKGHEKIL